jgi:hypothetical protein
MQGIGKDKKKIDLTRSAHDAETIETTLKREVQDV